MATDFGRAEAAEIEIEAVRGEFDAVHAAVAVRDGAQAGNLGVQGRLPGGAVEIVDFDGVRRGDGESPAVRREFHAIAGAGGAGAGD